MSSELSSWGMGGDAMNRVCTNLGCSRTELSFWGMGGDAMNRVCTSWGARREPPMTND
ncbi:hypothetical protein [Nodularia sphaerocarpa]|uniref:hypothetical protein n=1 Tax=Nodularia sphaerocarpa TaxID=137816 RepID=UPI001EFA356D|nr:hypothetical protein [Nodularia sphaerocarpa]MDB9372737.1 hypothetical protein [Nodularia sphaerocarpa CS-585]MDB9376692.1 hypothetical protein [Nodularia sphaerocarpa CS-585A2]